MSDHEFEAGQGRFYDRAAIVGVLLLLAAFLLGVVSVTSDYAKASGDDLVAKRDHGGDNDNSGPGSGDDDDDDDTGTGTNTGTATGTTKGTGASNTATNDTATGTRTGHR